MCQIYTPRVRVIVQRLYTCKRAPIQQDPSEDSH